MPLYLRQLDPEYKGHPHNARLRPSPKELRSGEVFYGNERCISVTCFQDKDFGSKMRPATGMVQGRVTEWDFQPEAQARVS